MPYRQPFNSDRVELNNWLVNAKDLQGESSSQSFGFSLPDGDPVVDQLFVYSNDYAGSTINGVEAMEVMTVVNNNLKLTADTSEVTKEFFELRFDVTDMRAKNYSLWFYTDDPDVLPVVKLEHDSSLIENKSIVPGGTTIVKLPWSEIEAAGIYSASAIRGVHIVLNDAPTDLALVQDGVWFAYEGISEYVGLSPSISSINTKVSQVHPTYWTKAGETADLELLVSVEFQVFDLAGTSNTGNLELVDNHNSKTFSLVSRSLKSDSLGAYYRSNEDVFNATFLQPTDLDRVELESWQINVTDLQGDDNYREFDFRLVDGEEVNDELFVYSDSYTDSITNGVQALEVMTVADNSLSIASDFDDQMFTIGFEVTDPRVKNYAIWLHVDETDIAPDAFVDFDSLSISDTPIVSGGLTTLILPWSEIELLVENIEVSAISGAHIVLGDESTDSELIEDGYWLNYEGVSEYFTITP